MNSEEVLFCVGARFYPARAVQRHKIECTNAERYAPVGADDPVRPAGCARKNECTYANPYHVCRGRCPHRPARRMTVFTIRCGKFVIAQRADRVVRPYRTLCRVAENACKFAIASCRIDVGIDPYGLISSLFTITYSLNLRFPYVRTNLWSMQRERLAPLPWDVVWRLRA